MLKGPPLYEGHVLTPDREVQQDSSRGGGSARHPQTRQGSLMWAVVGATCSLLPQKDFQTLTKRHLRCN